MRYVHGENRSQTAPFPVSLDELIPDAPLVRVIHAYGSLLNFEPLGFNKARPKGMGRPLYDPANRRKLFVYGYFQSIRSSRRLEAEYQRDVEVMWLWDRPALNSRPSLICGVITVPRSRPTVALLFGFTEMPT